MMNDGLRIIGGVYAWQDAGQWYYSIEELAPCMPSQLL